MYSAENAYCFKEWVLILLNSGKDTVFHFKYNLIIIYLFKLNIFVQKKNPFELQRTFATVE
jgi:hypothetical protein